jgi:D-sedoheptulose 7-phosphate isomerase
VVHPDSAVRGILAEHELVASGTRALAPTVAALATDIRATLASGGTLLVFGNGGSAADAQHLAAELVGHFRRPRRPLPAVALTTDSSVVSAIANDFSYEEVFERQVEALCSRGDIVVGISTSGTAPSVARGLAAARRLGARTWALTGGSGGIVASAAEHELRVPSDVTARVQEMHILIIHAVSEVVDAWAADEEPARAPGAQALR